MWHVCVFFKRLSREAPAVLIEEVADAGALTQAGLPLLGLSALSLALAAVPDPARVAKPAQMGWRPMS